MQAATFICAATIVFSACSSWAAPAAAPASKLSAPQKAAIGKKIWQNESGGEVAGLTAWNGGEEFPSLGIGHFIWYPKGFKGRFAESWPQFIAFARERGAKPPEVALQRHSPWNSKAEFQRDFKGAEMAGLRKWLSGTVELQTDYIIDRSRAALPKILAAAPGSERAKIEANYRKVSTTSQGTYALIDYVNFKGDGTQTSERYNGQGWGLMQVLGGMKEVSAGPAAATEFAASAKRVLSRRISNSPPARAEAKWLPGWHNRCETYAKPL
jgi:hypothetical protein